MPFISMDRIARGLRWAGGGLLLVAVALVVAGIGWTQGVGALITLATIAALAFALPGFLAFALAYWLESAAEQVLATPAGGTGAEAGAAVHPVAANPFREPWSGYAIAVAAVLLAWGARAALDPIIPQQTPFITFFLAVAVAGWLGGFGPAAVATLLSLPTAWMFFISGPSRLLLGTPGVAIVLGLFTFVCLGIGAITAALRTALMRAHQLATEATREAELLQESQARLHFMAHVAPILIRVSDTTKACVYLNETWLHFTGRTLQQQLGHGWTASVHPDDVARCLSTYESAFDVRAPFTVEYRLRGAHGSYRVVRDMGIARFESDGTFAGYVSACMDVTDLVAPQPDGSRLQARNAADAA